MLPAAVALFPSSSPIFLHNSTINLFLVSRRRIRRRLRLIPPHSAAEREEVEVEDEAQQLELDKAKAKAKAREALQKLDQQLQSLSEQKQQQTQLPKTPKPSAPYSSDPNLDRDLMTGMSSRGEMRGEMPEFSGSYLSYTAIALVVLTIFNNIIFNVIIKPLVDDNEEVSTIIRVPLKEP